MTMKKQSRYKKVYSIFVGHLPLNITKVDLYDLFKGCGTIAETFMKDQDGNKEFTYGFVRFTEKEAALRAIEEMDGWPVMHMKMKVELAQETKGYVDVAEPKVESKKMRRRSKPEDLLNLSKLRKCLTEMKKAQKEGDEPIDQIKLFEDIDAVDKSPIPAFTEELEEAEFDMARLDKLVKQWVSEEAQTVKTS